MSVHLHWRLTWTGRRRLHCEAWSWCGWSDFLPFQEVIFSCQQEGRLSSSC